MKSITWVVGVAGILALLSFVILFLITPSPDRGQLPSAAFGTIIAACVAGVAALAATESVGSRRRYETQQSINERRKVEYDKAIWLIVNESVER